MATSVVMPALELAQETGKVVAWKKQEGERVTKGEPLLEIETDKAVVEVEAPGTGELRGITAQPGDEIAVGNVIAWLLAPGEAVPAAHAAAITGRTSASGPSTGSTAASAPAPSAAKTGLVSPKARRLAQEHGVDLAQVRATGPNGEVLASDVQAYLDARGASSVTRPPEPAIGTVWKLMAERTSASWTTVPHFFLTREVDAAPLVARRSESKTPGVTYTDFLVALAARVLARHPRVNGSWANGGIKLNAAINVGVAVAAEDGVMVAVVRNADAATIDGISAERRAITERARSGRAAPADLTGATFTISNLGMWRVDAFTAIINPPQAAILAVGSIVDRVIAVDGQPVVRPVLTMTLSSDHRVIDGARAAAFMDDLANAIGDPDIWLK